MPASQLWNVHHSKLWPCPHQVCSEMPFCCRMWRAQATHSPWPVTSASSLVSEPVLFSKAFLICFNSRACVVDSFLFLPRTSDKPLLCDCLFTARLTAVKFGASTPCRVRAELTQAAIWIKNIHLQRRQFLGQIFNGKEICGFTTWLVDGALIWGALACK